MTEYPQFCYSDADVKRAGEIIAGPMIWNDDSAPTIIEAFQIANSWRDSHAYPMRSVRQSAIWCMQECNLDGFTAARLKRMQAIRRKLQRIKPKLNRLQDLGGCRVILPTVSDVRTLVGFVSEHTRHKIWNTDDYITNPKVDGYRSYHVKFAFQGDNQTAVYSGRRIELQVRTKLQHSWATTVEAVGLFRGEELKNHQGNAGWLRLFMLMSSEFAEIEGSPLPSPCPDKSGRRSEIRYLERELEAIKTLESVSHGVRGTDLPLWPGYRPRYYLIRYDHATRTVHVEPQDKPIDAASSYDNAEESDNRSGRTTQNVVLVEVDKIENLKAAYPNYFGDVELFKDRLRDVTLGMDSIKYKVPARQPARRPLPHEVVDPAWLRRRRFPGPSLKKKKKR